MVRFHYRVPIWGISLIGKTLGLQPRKKSSTLLFSTLIDICELKCDGTWLKNSSEVM